MAQKMKPKQNKEQLTEEYFKIKIELDKVIDSVTLTKYKLLSKAYKIGKKLYGISFSVNRLAIDYEMPYTTVKRVLSLGKANSDTWRKIRSKKISVFKVAQVLSTKDTVYQDEIIDMVIKNNLSTYGIKKIRINQYNDIKKTKTQIALDKGFSRDYEASIKLKNTINRLNELLDIDEKYLTISTKPELIKKLGELKLKIDKFIIRIKET